MKITSNDSPYQSFPAAVPANLVGMEGYAVELIPGTNTIQLYTATGGVPLLGCPAALRSVCAPAGLSSSA